MVNYSNKPMIYPLYMIVIVKVSSNPVNVIKIKFKLVKDLYYSLDIGSQNQHHPYPPYVYQNLK
jgi:hypothetical protein